MKKKTTKPVQWLWNYKIEAIKNVVFPFQVHFLKNMHLGIIPEGVKPVHKVSDN